MVLLTALVSDAKSKGSFPSIRSVSDFTPPSLDKPGFPKLTANTRFQLVGESAVLEVNCLPLRLYKPDCTRSQSSTAI